MYSFEVDVNLHYGGKKIFHSIIQLSTVVGEAEGSWEEKRGEEGK